MAKANIAGVEIDVTAHKDNTPEEQAAIFAHLNGSAKAAAIQEFNEALAKEVKKDEKQQAKAEPAKADGGK